MTKSDLSEGLRADGLIARMNIDRFERLLSAETDKAKRVRISALLSEERQKLKDFTVLLSTIDSSNRPMAPDPGAGQRDATLLEQMCDDLAKQNAFEGAVAATLEAAIRLIGADRGNVQLPAGDRLYIAENRGFAKPFLDTFREVRIGDGSACARSFAQRRPVVIPDVAEDAEFSPFRSDAAKAGFRGVVTTPMAAAGGVLIGFVSTHFTLPYRPAPVELQRLSAFCGIAANHLQLLLGADGLAVKASRMQATTYERASVFSAFE